MLNDESRCSQACSNAKDAKEQQEKQGELPSVRFTGTSQAVVGDLIRLNLSASTMDGQPLDPSRGAGVIEVGIPTPYNLGVHYQRETQQMGLVYFRSSRGSLGGL